PGTAQQPAAAQAAGEPGVAGEPAREPVVARAPETSLFVPAADSAAHTGENGAHQQADGRSG
ncbi:MAG TPA: hypothetical protein VE664_04070, partial [Actinomycetes bacterium]|nr:hypothetical protein [Actinomycetes bacterium]